MGTRLDAAEAQATSTGFTYTVSAGTNRCLIVGIQQEDSDLGTPTCTYGGETMAEVVDIEVNPALPCRVTLFYLNDAGIEAASSGAIVPSNAAPATTVHAASYQDVGQSTPTNTDTDSSTSSTPNPLTACDIVTGAADAIVVALAGMGNGGTAAWGGTLVEQTEQEEGGGSATGSLADDEVASATTIACECTWTTPNRAVICAFELVDLSAAGITGIVPTEFDMDNADVDVDGSDFESTQGSGTIYLSDANTLAGSANEVDISSAVNTWNDTQINLDLTQLSVAELDDLQTLGPGQRFIIVLTSNPNEYASTAITLHRPQAFNMSASANITASGENTTFQLAAPATKTTGDFGGGRIQDDENPTDAVDLAADEYREDEWCMEAKPLAEDDAVYQFRVVISGGALLDTYTVDPRWTVSAADTVVEAPLKTFTLTLLTPSSIATGVQAVSPLNTLTLTLFTPVVGSGVTVDTPLRTLTLTLLTPNVQTGASLESPLLTLTLTLLTPEVFTGVAQESPLLTLTLQLLDQPDVATGVRVEAPLRTLTLTLLEPVIGIGVTAVSPLLTLTLSNLVPDVHTGVTVEAPLRTLTLTLFTPSSVSTGVELEAPLATLTLTLLTPNVQTGVTATPPLLTLTLTTFVPAVGGGAQVVAPLKTFTLTLLTPDVHTGVTVLPPLLTLTLVNLLPTVGTGALVDGTPLLSLVLTLFTPTVQVGTVEWVIDPDFDGPCESNQGDGWQCNNGATIVGGEGILDDEGASEHLTTRLWDNPDNPPSGDITLYFHVRELSSGSGVRLRTNGSTLRGQFTAGDHEVTYSVDGGIQTIQFEIISGFGTWAIGWTSTVGPQPTGVTVEAPLRTLTLTLFTPAVGTGVEIDATLRTLILTLFTPVVGTGVIIEAPLRTLTLTLFTPVVGSGVTVDTPLRTLTLTLFTPNVQTGVTIEAPLRTLTLTLFTPALETGVTAESPLRTLTLTLLTPTVHTGVTVEAPLATLTLTLFTPVVGGGVTVEAPLRTLTLTLFTPVVATGVTVEAPLRTLTLTLFTPAVGFPEVPLLTLTLTLLTPDVEAAQGVAVTSPLLTLTLTLLLPQLPGLVVDAPLKSFPLNLLTPTVSAGGVNVKPQVLTLSLVLFTPTVGAIDTPLLSKTLVLHVPGVFSGVTNTVVTVPLLTLTLTLQAPADIATGVAVAVPLMTKAGGYTDIELVLLVPTVQSGAVVGAPLKSFPLNLFAPTVEIELVVDAPLLTLTLTLLTPTVVAVPPTIIEVPFLTLTLTLFAPSSVATGVRVVAPLLTKTLQLFVPSVVAAPALVIVETALKTFNLVLFPPTAVIGAASSSGDGVAVLSFSVGSTMLDGVLNSKMITATHGSVMTQARAG
jgi:hypothetical protein